MLIDISNHFRDSEIQFMKDIAFMEEIQARLLKAQESLKTMKSVGESILKYKEKILSQISDDQVKKALEHEFTKFNGRVTDITQGIQMAQTFRDFWDLLIKGHQDLIDSIRRVRYFTIPILATQEEMNHVLEKQEKMRVAIQVVDDYTIDMARKMSEAMTQQTQDAFEFEMERIEQTNEALAEMANTIIAMIKLKKEHDEKLNAAYTDAREKSDANMAEYLQQRQILDGVIQEQASELGLDELPKP